MLLGINAHVQNDMPFMLAAITLRDAKGRSRKDDHDAENKILDDAFDEVVREVARRYDPLASLQLESTRPSSDVFGAELVKRWREGVWRNAERLVNAETDEEREAVAESIHPQAALSAQTSSPPDAAGTGDPRRYCAANRPADSVAQLRGATARTRSRRTVNHPQEPEALSAVRGSGTFERAGVAGLASTGAHGGRRSCARGGVPRPAARLRGRRVGGPGAASARRGGRGSTGATGRWRRSSRTGRCSAWRRSTT